MKFLRAAWIAYKSAGPDGVGYCSVSRFGVPNITVLVAKEHEQMLQEIILEARDTLIKEKRVLGGPHVNTMPPYWETTERKT